MKPDLGEPAERLARVRAEEVVLNGIPVDPQGWKHRATAHPGADGGRFQQLPEPPGGVG